MENNVVIPTNNLEGNITSCKIENTLIKSERDSIFSFKEMNTYQSYDVCSKQIIQTYVKPEMTIFGFSMIVVLFIVAYFIIVSFFTSDSW